jgi:hypothetical protein
VRILAPVGTVLTVAAAPSVSARPAPSDHWGPHAKVARPFSGYNGMLFTEGFGGLPWHGVDLHASRLQPLPRVLRHPSVGYGNFRKALFFAWLLVRKPRTLLHKLRRLSRRR